MPVLGAPISVRFPSDLRDRVITIASITRRSPGDVVRESVERQIASMEWEYRVAERARAARAGEIATLPLDALIADLGLTEAEIDAAPLDSDDQ